MNIVLIGYRGAGKTVVGRALAASLQWPFCDLDQYIEDKAKRSIKEMVAEKGWSFFRAQEKEAIQDISGQDNCVIAPGGGAVMDAENVAMLRLKGWFVLLTATLDTMIKRIEGDAATAGQRPSLLGKDLYEESRAVLAERMPTYERVADLTIETTHLSVDEVVQRIIEEKSRVWGA
jgi:shikimate kinase